ncbi:Cytochrome oxidase biogenesis protein Sco1/SenC/PrrC, thiol-disulfide reductase involved in Cu(I) insertion into CoxII Cu(A) center / Cytochrome c [hydrothermal vent metagenome]|uniref:Cytochrome oxidase biogenesis protein Sco1/SenC/PrrC, thiol-disulfide reductase involved in Cu(I) insertion into CoxII Cu(A) center / Cytochrome c n=1 Tax=hydrothermal vent metagenome TaxID=652676 RepID=A0A3B0X6R9_9ZZZZ
MSYFKKIPYAAIVTALILVVLPVLTACTGAEKPMGGVTSKNADKELSKFVLRAQSRKPKEKKQRRASQNRFGEGYFPNIELTNQDGEKVRFFDDLIKDKVVAINFMFTSCQNICPLETARLKEVYDILGDRVGKEFFFYSISIDSERDTPEVLKDYKKRFGIGDGWQFLTGNKEEIDQLRVKLGLYIADLDQDLPDGQIDHNISLVMGNQKTGRWMKRSPFEEASVLATMFGQWLTNWEKAPKGGHVDYKETESMSTIYSDGEYAFRTRCATCHTIGGGDGVGPDLLGVLKRRDRQWLSRWIRVPNEMIKEKDPIVMEMMEKYKGIIMPNLKLGTGDVKNLFEFFEAADTALGVPDSKE